MLEGLEVCHPFGGPPVGCHGAELELLTLEPELELLLKELRLELVLELEALLLELEDEL